MKDRDVAVLIIKIAFSCAGTRETIFLALRIRLMVSLAEAMKIQQSRPRIMVISVGDQVARCGIKDCKQG
jgi:hypothetical protein